MTVSGSDGPMIDYNRKSVALKPGVGVGVGVGGSFHNKAVPVCAPLKTPFFEIFSSVSTHFFSSISSKSTHVF